MNPRKGLVLDANILLRAVFGTRVRQLLETYEDAAFVGAPLAAPSVRKAPTFWSAAARRRFRGGAARCAASP